MAALHHQAIGEAKSKQEEDRIILDEMAVLKQKMPTQVRRNVANITDDTVLSMR